MCGSSVLIYVVVFSFMVREISILYLEDFWGYCIIRSGVGGDGVQVYLYVLISLLVCGFRSRFRSVFFTQVSMWRSGMFRSRAYMISVFRFVMWFSRVLNWGQQSIRCRIWSWNIVRKVEDQRKFFQVFYSGFVQGGLLVGV